MKIKACLIALFHSSLSLGADQLPTTLTGTILYTLQGLEMQPIEVQLKGIETIKRLMVPQCDISSERELRHIEREIRKFEIHYLGGLKVKARQVQETYSFGNPHKVKRELF